MPGSAGAQPQGGGTRQQPPCPGGTCCCRSCCILADMGCHILVDHTSLRWGRRSFEWRWRAIALATAGCALPAPCAELRAARAAALSIRPLAARRLLPIPPPPWTRSFSPCRAWRGFLRQCPHPSAPHPRWCMVPWPVAGVREPPWSPPKFGCVCPFGAADGPGALGLF